MDKELVIIIIEALEAEHVRYILAGSFASMVYGIPRSTKDMDFVVELERPQDRVDVENVDGGVIGVMLHANSCSRCRG